MEERLEHLTRVMERGFQTLADTFVEQIGQTNARLDRLTERVDVLTERVDVLTERVDVLTERVDVLTGEVRGLNSRFDNFVTGAHREDHAELRQRIERIELHLGLPKTND